MPFVRFATAPLLAVYGAIVVRASAALTEAMLMIHPRPRGIIRRAHAWATLKTPVTFVASSRSNASGGKSSSGARCCSPALLTRMSIGPVASSASIARATASRVRDVERALLGAVDLRGRRGELPGVAAVEDDRRTRLRSPRASASPIALEDAGDHLAPAGEIEHRRAP